MKKIFLIIAVLCIFLILFLANTYPNQGGYIGYMTVLEKQIQDDKYIIIGQLDPDMEIMEIRVKFSKGDTLIQDTGYENKEVSIEHIWDHIEKDEYHIILSNKRRPFNIRQEYQIQNILLSDE
ncbi:hypothetical protein ACM26V_00630 [Salipaludibacillus sp. HK11]|uniref:hypothetical protein n=1 Tax=Salipaludibacillus sp. HK11 TaxID=3394320 RepID=UPI0039FC8997